MAFAGGLALKGLSWFLRIFEFCCTALILAIFSYFLATLHSHGVQIENYVRAVEGISGAGLIYTILSLLLVCCLGGFATLSTIAMVLDLAFTGGFAYVAYATRAGDGSCNGNVNTPFGSGDSNSHNAGLSLHTACRLETAAFGVSIVAVVFFFLSIFVELALIRHHKREKAFGPSPNNGYTAGSPRKMFWQRKQKNRDAELAAEKPDALPIHATPADYRASTTPAEYRTSYATDATAVGQEPLYSKYGNANMTGGVAPPHHGAHAAATIEPGAGYEPYRPENNTTGTF